MKSGYESVEYLRTNSGKQEYSQKWIERTLKMDIEKAIGGCLEAAKSFHSTYMV